MSFFKSMASVGIGSAKVKTILEAPFSGMRPGDEISGRILVEGGAAAQPSNGIELLLLTSIVKEANGQKVREQAVIDSLRLRQAFLIEAGAREELPFRWQLPLTAPMTMGGTQLWIKTSMNIASALDAGGNDYIQVLPHPLVENILEAFHFIGLRVREADCRSIAHSGCGTPLLQELELVPVSSSRFGRLEELEIAFLPASSYVDIRMEVDRQGGAFADSVISFRLYQADISRGVEDLAENLAARIQSCL